MRTALIHSVGNAGAYSCIFRAAQNLRFLVLVLQHIDNQAILKIRH
jgi:hypothetical protein